VIAATKRGFADTGECEIDVDRKAGRTLILQDSVPGFRRSRPWTPLPPSPNGASPIAGRRHLVFCTLEAGENRATHHRADRRFRLEKFFRPPQCRVAPQFVRPPSPLAQG
jgi:hypothetical protein